MKPGEMTLEDMKVAWQALDARVQKQQVLSLQLLKDDKFRQVRHGLRPLILGQVLQLVVGVLFAIWAGAFWTTHLQPLHLLVWGVLVHVFGILMIGFAARNLYLIQRIDNAAPVLGIQRQIAKLRAFRVRVEAPVNAVLGCFIWIPVTWMALAWYGIDLWAWSLLWWAVASSLVGLVAVALVVLLMRRMGYARKIEDESAGRSIVRVEAVLEEIARFEQE